MRSQVTLPSSGYFVTLFQSAELIRPPKVYFLCKSPESKVDGDSTNYVVHLKIPFQQIMLTDASGNQKINATSDGVMVLNAPTISAPKACKTDAECGATAFCDTTPKCPDGRVTGMCITKPQICSRIFLPVLACNGQTYSNHCEAMADGQAIPGILRTRLMDPGNGPFPLRNNSKDSDPGDHWPFNCLVAGGPGDAWPWKCKK